MSADADVDADADWSYYVLLGEERKNEGVQRRVEEKEQAQEEKKNGERKEEASAWQASRRRRISLESLGSLRTGPGYRDGKTRLGGFHGFINACFYCMKYLMLHSHLEGPGNWQQARDARQLGKVVAA